MNFSVHFLGHAVQFILNINETKLFMQLSQHKLVFHVNKYSQ